MMKYLGVALMILAVLCLPALVLPGIAAPPPHKPHEHAKHVAGHPCKGPPAGFTPRRVAAKPALATASAVIFPPLPGTNLAPGSSPSGSLKSPTVNVIFHGNSWTAADRQTVVNAVQAILSGPYLSALSQPNYGSDGKAVWGSSSVSNATLELDTPSRAASSPATRSSTRS